MIVKKKWIDDEEYLTSREKKKLQRQIEKELEKVKKDYWGGKKAKEPHWWEGTAITPPHKKERCYKR